MAEDNKVAPPQPIHVYSIGGRPAVQVGDSFAPLSRASDVVGDFAATLGNLLAELRWHRSLQERVAAYREKYPDRFAHLDAFVSGQDPDAPPAADEGEQRERGIDHAAASD